MIKVIFEYYLGQILFLVFIQKLNKFKLVLVIEKSEKAKEEKELFREKYIELYFSLSKSL